MAENNSNDRFLKEFNIKPCRVRLDRGNFSKIRMTCKATSSEKHVKLICDMKQTGINTILIKVATKRPINEELDEIHPAKKANLSESTAAGNRG